MKFFHLETLIRRRRNRIEALQLEDGSWVEDQLTLKDLAISYFRNLYASNTMATGDFIIGCFPRLSAENQLELNKEYTKDVVVRTIKGIGALKAPGPDGLQEAFYQRAGTL